MGLSEMARDGAFGDVRLVTVIVVLITVPLTLDIVRSFLPPRLRSARLVGKWYRPVLLLVIVCICVWAYYLFWVSILLYSHTLLSLYGITHACFVSLLWFNTVSHYSLCAALDPGFLPPPGKDEERQPTAKSEPIANSADKSRAHFCKTCNGYVRDHDHHCPFTGGCVGANNYRHFLLFALHCWVGCTYACALSYAPFRDCVLFDAPTQKCRSLGERAYVFIPAGAIVISLSLLLALHLMLLCNGLTTARFVKMCQAGGGISGLSRHHDSDIDKWSLLFGPGRSVSECLRILLLPSLPPASVRRLSPGVAAPRPWLYAALVVGSFLLLKSHLWLLLMQQVQQLQDRIEAAAIQGRALRMSRGG